MISTLSTENMSVSFEAPMQSLNSVLRPLPNRKFKHSASGIHILWCMCRQLQDSEYLRYTADEVMPTSAG